MKLQCVSCHNTKGRAPVLEGIWDTEVLLKGGGKAPSTKAISANRFSDPEPRFTWVGSRSCPRSPDNSRTIVSIFTEEDVLIRLIAYIKSTGPGQTPVRTEHFPAAGGCSDHTTGRRFQEAMSTLSVLHPQGGHEPEYPEPQKENI